MAQRRIWRRCVVAKLLIKGEQNLSPTKKQRIKMEFNEEEIKNKIIEVFENHNK